jgi:hypothetical protein
MGNWEWVGGTREVRSCASLFLLLIATGGCSNGGLAEGDGTSEELGTASLPITVSELFPVGPFGSLDGRLVTFPCGDDNPLGTDCASGGAWYRNAQSQPVFVACSGGALNVNHVFPVAGNPGTSYSVTLHFYGIVEPKVYGSGVTREAAPGRPANTDSGSPPTPFATAAGGHAYSASDHNSYELRVCTTPTCATNSEIAVYYLNADTRQGQWTYVLNFEKTISVIGGGSVRVRRYDSNCRQIKNCGPEGTPANLCAQKANARIINVSGANPVPLNAWAAQGGLTQPALVPQRPAGSSGQWFYIDVVSVN